MMILTCLAHSSGDLWFSAPSSLNRKFVNHGTKVAKFRDTVNSAIELTCDIAFGRIHTPRACFLKGCEYFVELRTRQGLEFGRRDEGVVCREKSALTTFRCTWKRKG